MSRDYFWIVAQDESGQRYLIFGSDRSSEDARRVGFEMGMNDFEIKKMPTRDLPTASHYLKYGIARNARNISEAGKRLRHQAPRHRRLRGM